MHRSMLGHATRISLLILFSFCLSPIFLAGEWKWVMDIQWLCSTSATTTRRDWLARKVIANHVRVLQNCRTQSIIIMISFYLALAKD